MDLKNRTKEIKNFFNNKIDTYDQVHETYMSTKKALIDSLEGNINKVLDLGAGTGLELIYLFEKYPQAKVTVVDISDGMLEQLMKRKFADKITCICGDFFCVDFGKEYDAVISTSALHHFASEDKLKLYKKIKECLRVGGQFLNCDKIALSLEEQERLLNEYKENPNKYPHMDTPLTIENECKLLLEAGFEDVAALSPNTIKSNYVLLNSKKR